MMLYITWGVWANTGMDESFLCEFSILRYIIIFWYKLKQDSIWVIDYVYMDDSIQSHITHQEFDNITGSYMSSYRSRLIVE